MNATQNKKEESIMKTVVGRNDLIEVVKKAAKAVKKSSETMEALLLEISRNQIKVTGSNPAFSITSTLPCASEGEYNVLVNAAFVQNLLPKMPEEEVTIKQEGGILTISSGSMIFTLDALDASAFAKRREVTNPRIEALVDGNQLNEAVNKVAHACGSINASPIQASIHLELTGEEMCLTAMSDARISQRGSTNGNVQVDILINAANAKETFPLLSGNVSLKLDDATLYLADSQTIINIGLVEGLFYKVESLVKKDSKAQEIQFRKRDLIMALEAAMLVNQDCVELEVSPDNMTIKASKDSASYSVKIPVVAERPLSIYFDPVNMIDAIKSIDEDTVIMELIGDRNPAIFRGEGYIELMCPKILK